MSRQQPTAYRPCASRCVFGKEGGEVFGLRLHVVRRALRGLDQHVAQVQRMTTAASQRMLLTGCLSASTFSLSLPSVLEWSFVILTSLMWSYTLSSGSKSPGRRGRMCT